MAMSKEMTPAQMRTLRLLAHEGAYAIQEWTNKGCTSQTVITMDDKAAANRLCLPYNTRRNTLENLMERGFVRRRTMITKKLDWEITERGRKIIEALNKERR